MTFGAPTAGEILAERYQLEEHIDNDSAGRQVWRGIDVILRRPVAVVLRYPGGESAAEMLGRASPPAGSSTPTWSASTTRSTRASGPTWCASGSTGIACATSSRPARWTRRGPPRSPTRSPSAVAAVHATGMVHGNIHPGTVLIADDGRVVLADARADDADHAGDRHPRDRRRPLLRADRPLAAHRGRADLAFPTPSATATAALAAPRQVRAGVPAYLDDLAIDLLDADVAAAAGRRARRRAGRLGQTDDDTATIAGRGGADYGLRRSGPTAVAAAVDAAAARPASRSAGKLAIGVVGLLVIALVGIAGRGQGPRRR